MSDDCGINCLRMIAALIASIDVVRTPVRACGISGFCSACALIDSSVSKVLSRSKLNPLIAVSRSEIS